MTSSHPPPFFRHLSLLIAILMAVFLMSACQETGGDSTPTADIPATPAPSPSPTPAPLGSQANPIVIGFLLESGSDSRNTNAMDEIAQGIAEATGLSVISSTYGEPLALFTALEEGQAHLAWLHPLTYIYARERNLVEVGLLTNHFGSYYYGSQFLANIQSGFFSYFDPNINQSTADAATALFQLHGRRPCWVDPGSISGYILPLGILEANGIETQPAVIAQTHTAVIRALYIKGVCDFGATFAISGDPRTSSAVLDDLTDAGDRVIVIWQSEADIPNLNLSYANEVPAATVRAINEWFIEFIKSGHGKSTLTRALNGYDVQDLRVVDDSIYDPLRSAVDLAGADVSQWVGR